VLPPDYLYLPLTIGAISVGFDVPSAGLHEPGRLKHVASSQVDVQVPWELQSQTSAYVKVVRNGSYVGAPKKFALSDCAPGIFEETAYAESRAVAQHHRGYELVGPSSPAARGEWIILYANGLGPED
jgi:uncharacterized protein (TIGR03437 family)